MRTPYSKKITAHLAWHSWVTPKPARDQPVHRWYLFPHSFTSELVHALIDEWGLSPRSQILDPFVGAGTTLLAAKEKNIPAMGYDLSPLAVFVSNTKANVFRRARLEKVWSLLQTALRRSRPGTSVRLYPELVHRALPGGRIEKFDAIASCIKNLPCSSRERDFFRLALLSLIPQFSHAVANGGWLRWLNQGEKARRIADCFHDRVEMMLSDVNHVKTHRNDHWKALLVDSRVLPERASSYSAVITSPPYPNRHDYTRVFGIELMFDFLDFDENRALRHQSFESHPESRPERPQTKNYKPPQKLERSIRELEDGRLRHMLRGYFLDMHLCLREVARVCRPGAKSAFVLGNAQYSGQPILVDEFTAELGEKVGLCCREIRTVRWRGNSSQQMGKYGRNASRESVVIFEKRRHRPRLKKSISTA